MKTVQIASLLFSALLLGCAGSPDRGPVAPEQTELHAMSGSELIVVTRAEPARAFGLIWDALEIDLNSDIITWCTHKQGIQEVEPCREYVLTQAGILLDTTQFGTPDEVALFLGGADADGHAVALALGPVFEEQFAGGFAQPLGRVLAGRKIREEQQRRHKRMLESRGAVRVFVDARDTRKPTQELVDEILSAFESDPSAVVDLLFAS
ncbi:MAG: hypothetical protein R3200_07190, partial [Xanthomonadales bacterium]|nr:hypothetical protein [Xanthomonadales bacterium]